MADSIDKLPTIKDYNIQELTKNLELQKIGWTMWWLIWHDDRVELEEVYHHLREALHRERTRYA